MTTHKGASGYTGAPLARVMLVLGATACALFDPGAVRAQDLPRVHVFATGGTIAGRTTGGQLTGAQIVEAVPALDEVATIEVEEFSRIGSSAMTPDHWLRLARRINGLFDADPDLAGVVVMHGTDTMEETGYFLHLTVEDPRPVVMVGSMRNSSAVSADGPANLLSAVRVATHPGATGAGALVVLNDEVHSARDVRKRDSNRVETFGSEWGPLGVVDSDGIVFRHSVATRHTTGSRLHLPDGPLELPAVPIVADFTGNDGSVLDRWVETGVRGVVVQAFGGGRASPGMRRAVADASEAGVRVVLASRVPEGRVLAGLASPSRGVVTAGDLSPQKARILLMLGLLDERAGAELQRLFDTH